MLARELTTLPSDWQIRQNYSLDLPIQAFRMKDVDTLMDKSNKLTNGKNDKMTGKIINSQASMDKAVKSICDILRRDKAKGARLYVPELTWMFFLRYLDIMEQKEEQRAKAVGRDFQPSIAAPYRWRDWAAPFDHRIPYDETILQQQGWKRHELEKVIGSYLSFVNDELFPYLKTLARVYGKLSLQIPLSQS